jgi:hypothetical protein
MLTTNGGSGEAFRERKMKCDRTTYDPKRHTGPFTLLKVEDDGLRIARCEGCGCKVAHRPKKPEQTEPLLELADKPNDLTTLFNTDLAVWEDAAKHYRVRQDGGPMFRVLEGCCSAE